MALTDLRIFTLVVTTLFLIGGIAGLLLGRLSKRWATRLALICALSASLLIAYYAARFWGEPMDGREPPPILLQLPSNFSLPAPGQSFFIDRLAAFFLLLTGTLSAGVALYSFVWLADKAEQHRIASAYNLFVLFTTLTLMADNVYLFLVFLECMTLTFSYLSLYRHNRLLEGDQEDRREMAGAKLAFKAYLIFSHVGVVFITAALILPALLVGGVSFDTLREFSYKVEQPFASAIFLLGLIGLGIKGGFAPAHPWVSIVHPKSPTTTHALTLGLIIKVSSFYMLIRLCFEFLPPGPWWWGWLALLLAGLTALAGVFYAITSRDLKTALSNHSVENLGIILAGVGMALLLSSSHLPPSLAGLAMVAGLYHLLNHTVFKGLLYLGAGAIENQTGTVDLEELGGLMQRFPWISVTFLIGAIAISGFPPFNGFISEWLTLQAIFASQDLFASVQPWMVVALFGALLMLGTAFGLTALAFVKIVGEALLGMPRRPQLLAVDKQGEAPWKMRGVLVVLALLCLLLGLFPGLVADQLALLAGDLLRLKEPLTFGTSATSLTVSAVLEGHSYTARLAMLPLLLLALPPLALATLLGARRGRWGRGPLWSCGTDYRPEAMQITGGAFAFLTWEWAGGRFAPLGPADEGHLYRTPVQVSAGSAREGSDGDEGGEREDRIPWQLPISETRYVREDFRRMIDTSTQRLLEASTRFGGWFQGGDIRQYLSYLFLVFILVLIASVAWGGK